MLGLVLDDSNAARVCREDYVVWWSQLVLPSGQRSQRGTYTLAATRQTKGGNGPDDPKDVVR